ncbi:phytanoyl-CoA dioxygenase family protein [Brachybacterium sp. UNK5269]|uniref:phytanoyl-CoA dioxygenase family protein n=1 Tax=Brachybacterium sp. UNK5269 TaxID=3408576 RepID=UPI003BB13FF1
MTTNATLSTFDDPTAPDLASAFARDGYVILDNAIDDDLVEALKRDAARICRGELGEVAASPASTGPVDDEDLMRQFLCIHYPHKISGAARTALHAPRIVDALTRVIGSNVKAMQSMLFIKSEGKPGQAWHQDEFFIPTRDRSLTAVWIAVDDATVENGCLWVLPGSHRRGVLYPDREQRDPAFDCSIEAYDFPWEDADAVPVEIPAGSAIIFNGYLLHRSLQNSGRHGYRRALANHYMSAESLLPWQQVPEGSHVGKHDFRDIVMIAGEDPYRFKGTIDVARPHSRPDQDGGCDR